MRILSVCTMHVAVKVILAFLTSISSFSAKIFPIFAFIKSIFMLFFLISDDSHSLKSGLSSVSVLFGLFLPRFWGLVAVEVGSRLSLLRAGAAAVAADGGNDGGSGPPQTVDSACSVRHNIDLVQLNATLCRVICHFYRTFHYSPHNLVAPSGKWKIFSMFNVAQLSVSQRWLPISTLFIYLFIYYKVRTIVHTQ